MNNLKRSLQMLAILPFSFNALWGTPIASEHVLSQKEMSLENRYGNEFVNNVFKDNILLNLAYMEGKITSSKDIKWDDITKPFQYEFNLAPGKTFAFHSDVEKKYEDSLVKTTNAHFNAGEGFRTDGYLFGDGVCHLASLINWAAREAGLSVEAPTNHNFADIPDIPKEFGVSIYSNPNSKGSNILQNLYISNNKSKPIAFKFQYVDNKIKVSVVELN